MANTREQWLVDAVDKLRPMFKDVGYPLPKNVRVSCGWPSKRAMSRGGNRRIGECWVAEASEDKIPQIFISPSIEDSVDVLDILTHELIHAIGISGHKQDFKVVAMLVGLEGPMTATHAGEKLKSRLDKLAKKIGDYPHAKIDGTQGKKQSTRLLKVSCDDCGYIARVTAKWLGTLGPPICPGCQDTMIEG